MRLIDGDNAQFIDESFCVQVGECESITVVPLETIREAPTVDAVEVVRCVDCKYRDGMPGQPNILCYQMHDDDFCSYGEREELTQ